MKKEYENIIQFLNAIVLDKSGLEKNEFIEAKKLGLIDVPNYLEEDNINYDSILDSLTDYQSGFDFEQYNLDIEHCEENIHIDLDHGISDDQYIMKYKDLLFAIEVTYCAHDGYQVDYFKTAEVIQVKPKQITKTIYYNMQ